MFSKRTIIEIVNSLNLKTHDEVERLGIEFNIENEISGEYIKRKETSIVKYLISNPEIHGPNGSNLVIEILEHSINNHRGFEAFSEKYFALSNSLEKDGFEVVKKKIKKILPSLIPIVEQEDQLINDHPQSGWYDESPWKGLLLNSY